MWFHEIMIATNPNRRCHDMGMRSGELWFLGGFCWQFAVERERSYDSYLTLNRNIDRFSMLLIIMIDNQIINIRFR